MKVNSEIKIANLSHIGRGALSETVIYVGRGTIYGNPYVMSDEAQRDQVCDDYMDYFIDKIEHDPEFVRHLDELARLATNRGQLTLVCHCFPKRCHADTIKGYLLSLIARQPKF